MKKKIIQIEIPVTTYRYTEEEYFEASDGGLFKTEAECIRWEAEVKREKEFKLRKISIKSLDLGESFIYYQIKSAEDFKFVTEELNDLRNFNYCSEYQKVKRRKDFPYMMGVQIIESDNMSGSGYIKTQEEIMKDYNKLSNFIEETKAV